MTRRTSVLRGTTIVLLGLLLFSGLTTSLAADADADSDGEPRGLFNVSMTVNGVDVGQPLSPYSPRIDRDRPWTWTFAPFGTIHGWQHSELSETTWWDYGTTMHVQFGRGRGHAVWFGVAYRQAAGFDDGATITPFDPRYIDSAQLLTWRYQLARRHTLFTHWERWCYHAIDRRSPLNPFWTNATLGYGTVSPPEAWAMGLRRAQQTGKPQIDYYLYAGSIIHGGPADILGNWPRWQGRGRAWAALAWPVTGLLVLEAQLSWEAMLLTEREPERWRHKGDARLTAMVMHMYGAVTFFTGYRLHDDIPYRTTPTSLYIGIGYRI